MLPTSLADEYGGGGKSAVSAPSGALPAFAQRFAGHFPPAHGRTNNSTSNAYTPQAAYTTQVRLIVNIEIAVTLCVIVDDTLIYISG